jgi:Reverse transcriptase (RNA-dependent DNA polymerase).
MPLHPNQHSYQAGKSVETAIHQLLFRVHKALGQQETAPVVFIDIEGDFNNTSFDSTCAALFRHGFGYTIVRWIRATLKARLVTATLNGSFMTAAVSRVCPQGGL